MCLINKFHLFPLLFNFALEYAIRKVQVNKVGLKLNDADNVNLLGGNRGTLRKSTEILIDARKEVGLEVNIEEIKYMLLTSHQNAGQNLDRESKHFL
jgi:hypothetical protein